jgi:hypothetical protein
VCVSRALLQRLSLSRALGARGRFLSLSCSVAHALALSLARAVARKTTTTTQFLKRSRAENNVNQEINRLFFFIKKNEKQKFKSGFVFWEFKKLQKHKPNFFFYFKFKKNLN